MKTLVSALVLSASFLGAASVQAGELDWPDAADTASTLTRAEVRADLQAARDHGLLTNGEQAYPAADQGRHATASRDQVRQDLAQARAAGELTTGEQSYPPVEG